MTDSSPLTPLFRQSLGALRELYVGSARWCVDHYPECVEGDPDKFVQLMDDLHAGLLAKVFVTVANADGRWSPGEEQCASALFEHVWQRSLTGEALRNALGHVTRQAADLKWYALLRPFDKIPPLRSRIGELEAIVLRIANILAKADGEVVAAETAAMARIHAHLIEIQDAFRASPPAEPTIPMTGGLGSSPRPAGARMVAETCADARRVRDQCRLPETDRALQGNEPESLESVLAELDQLIGIESVKQEVRTLSNFLKVQHCRKQAGLPTTALSLHMVFEGNPGTGKTTVARLVGRILRSLGILDKGHIVEIDRSGLVAEFAGQTSPKANKTIDAALDGILFIDEAYSLVAESGDDPFGNEAVQTLLKRMEDNRQRLVVTLAGYPEPMERLLKTNPGISSRIGYQIAFPDYSTVELGRIFEIFCKQNQYRIPSKVRAKLLLGFQWLFDHRDEHFGNARAARNAFEVAIRQLANRVIGIAPLTKKLLTTFDADDILMPDVPAEVWDRLDDDERRFRVECPGCHVTTEMPRKYLGQRMECKKCHHRFVADWGEPV
ncbi:MAG: AAA family ATPase [Pirellulales bacterium]|nr:AAA family ATPase [Pirellulales bacterium]